MTDYSDSYCSIGEQLWSMDGSVWCQCNHHLSNHYTTTNGAICKFKVNSGHCECTEFRPIRKATVRATNGIDVVEYERLDK